MFACSESPDDDDGKSVADDCAFSPDESFFPSAHGKPTQSASAATSLPGHAQGESYVITK